MVRHQRDSPQSSQTPRSLPSASALLGLGGHVETTRAIASRRAIVVLRTWRGALRAAVAAVVLAATAVPGGVLAADETWTAAGSPCTTCG